MSRLRFKDDEGDLVAVAMATFEKPVMDAEKLRKEMQSNEFTNWMMNRIRTGNWKNCTKLECVVAVYGQRYQTICQKLSRMQQ